MSRTPAKVTQSDINRVLKAARQNGMGQVSIEIRPDGTVAFNLDTKGPSESAQGAGPKQKAWAPL